MAKSDLHMIGVDLGGTNIQAGVVSAGHEVVGRAKNKTQADQGSQVVIDRIAQTVEEAIAQAKVDRKHIGGVCVGAPGVVDVAKGLVRTAVNLRWSNFPLTNKLRDRLELPVTLDNDVNVGTWGEHVAGAAKGQTELLGVFIGTGIGGALVLRGELYDGHFGTAGEIGHVVLHADGSLGRRTLENCASRTNIVGLLEDLIRASHASSLAKADDGSLNGKVRSKALAQAIRDQDPLTVEVVRQAAAYAGVAIANTVTLLGLPCVVLGGGLVEAVGRPYVGWVREAFDKHVFPTALRKCRIVASKLGDDAGVIGAADLARRRLT